MTDELTVAILAGGESKRFRSDKALALFRGVPLLTHMVGIARRLSNRTLVIVSDDEQRGRVKKAAEPARIEVDPDGAMKCALTGAVTAFELAETRHTMLLPVDTPLAKVELLRVIADLAPGHGAVVPSWPNGNTEPLHAVYLSEHAYARGLSALDEGKRRMQDLLDSLKRVLYVSTNALTQFDSEMVTFANINTEQDLKRLESTYTYDT
ncbi:MAG: molybdenum cofactor guanylyltransferase [Candidatus Thorarchaeota archaeon]|nr:molybdenum cofactor guanylyltransferase [Candidatus Thorarchaeota archaeon]